MPADKKISRKDLPRPEGKDVRNNSQEEYDDKPKDQKPAKNTKDDSKANLKKGLKYVIKDLPIY